ncbi:MAG: MBOAT family protein [Pacificimonas sp.]|nr:MBOAT family protein [Pacificimonas sp.]
MLFNSYIFILVFLPIVMAGFVWLGRRSPRLTAGWLVLASLFFYGWWNPPYVLILCGSIVVNFLFGGAISRAGGGRKALLWAGIGFNLLLFGYYKYAGFFVDSWNGVSGGSFSLGDILLPIGISFYTFTQIAYLVDCHRGRAEDYDLLNYALFVSFFPQLLAGPILHHSEMMPQFAAKDADPAGYRLTSENMAVGSTIFIIGLFKKVVLADGVAPFANTAFAAAEAGESLDLLTAWVGILAYTFQLYFDFSGYSDMAIGLARMFGIILPLNFASPYKARSMSQIWQSWHMTLSRFLRDYIYIPLGGNRRGVARRYVNMFVTMLLGGMWHGAGWTFIVWGAVMGVFMLIHQAWEDLGFSGRLPGRVCWAMTFLAILTSLTFFRAESLSGAWAMLVAMAGANGAVMPNVVLDMLGILGDGLRGLGVAGIEGPRVPFLMPWLWIAVLGGLAFFAPNTQQIMARYKPALVMMEPPAPAALTWYPSLRWAAATAVLALIAFLSLARPSEFLYFQF